MYVSVFVYKIVIIPNSIYLYIHEYILNTLTLTYSFIYRTGGTLLSYLVGPRLRWSKKKNMYGMSKLLDKPVLNYVSPWKKFVKWMEGNSDQKADE